MKNSQPVNNNHQEHPRQGQRYQTSCADQAEADRLAGWLASITLPESFPLAPGVLIVDGKLFRYSFAKELRLFRIIDLRASPIYVIILLVW